jgi:hypothetical protein
MNEPVGVTGIWLVRIGDAAIVKAEIDGHWVEVIREGFDGFYSHIVEPGGMRAASKKAREPVP